MLTHFARPTKAKVLAMPFGGAGQNSSKETYEQEVTEETERETEKSLSGFPVACVFGR